MKPKPDDKEKQAAHEEDCNCESCVDVRCGIYDNFPACTKRKGPRTLNVIESNAPDGITSMDRALKRGFRELFESES